jgi:hypothetical protein
MLRQSFAQTVGYAHNIRFTARLAGRIYFELQYVIQLQYRQDFITQLLFLPSIVDFQSALVMGGHL